MVRIASVTQLLTNEKPAAVDDWPEPGEIKETELLPVAQITPEMLPKAFREWLSDVSYRMQCPLEFVAVGAMVAASSVIGAGCGIRPKRRDNWTVTPNLWAMSKTYSSIKIHFNDFSLY